MYKRMLLAAVLCLIGGCSKKDLKNQAGLPRDISLFIEMPKNTTVFANIGPIVYEVLWNHYHKVGFSLTSQNNSDFRIKTKIERLEHPERFVSADVLPYMFKVNIELKCTLLDENNKLVTVKTFNFFRWVSRPKDPVLNWTYLHAQYKELLEKSMPRIDQFFRPFIVDNRK